MKRYLSILATLVVLAGCHDPTAPDEQTAGRSERPLLALGYGEGDHEFQKAVNACIDKFEHDGEDAKNIVAALKASKKHHKITKASGAAGTSYDDPKDATRKDVPVKPSQPGAGKGTGKGTAATVEWDPAWKPLDDSPDGKPTDPCTVLLHELRHALDADKGTRDPRPEPGSKIPQHEVDACTSENKYRKSQGQPQRTTYGGVKLPDSAISK